MNFVQSLFAFLLALSFQARLSFSAAAFLVRTRGREVGSSVYFLVSLFLLTNRACVRACVGACVCVKKYTSIIYNQ